MGCVEYSHTNIVPGSTRQGTGGDHSGLYLDEAGVARESPASVRAGWVSRHRMGRRPFIYRGAKRTYMTEIVRDPDHSDGAPTIEETGIRV